MLDRDALQKRLLATFREEAAEHVQSLEHELQRLSDQDEASARPQILETLFRVMHTLKGAARSVRFAEVEAVCQTSEALLHGITRGEKSLTDAHVATLKDAVTSISRMVHAPSVPAPSQAAPPQAAPSQTAAADKKPDMPPPAPAAVAAVGQTQGEPLAKSTQPQAAAPISAAASVAQSPASEAGLAEKPALSVPPLAAIEAPEQPRAAVREASAGASSVRVSVSQLDRLLQVAEDMLMPSMVLGERSRAARQLAMTTARLRQDVRNAGAAPGMQQSQEKQAQLLAKLREIEHGSKRLAEALREDQRGLATAVSDLFKETRQARMLPAASIFAAFSGMVRDLCQSTGKQAKWRLRDNGVELDRKVIEIVKDPLIHLVRNAVDHGIESPQEREATGKPPRGKITASIRPMEGGRVAIEISDDGRGMDISMLRNAALRARIASQAQLQELSDAELIDLAFRSGVSTRTVISSLSGLGLGLSIVREQIERMDGRVSVQSALGKGTSFRLELPASVASYRGLLVSEGGARLLLPSEAVLRVLGLANADAAASLHSGILSHDGQALPCARLGAALGLPKREATGEARQLQSAVLMMNAGRRCVVMVDEVIGETDVLVKDLAPPLHRVLHIASAGLLPTGEMALVLRPSDILATMHARKYLDGETQPEPIEKDRRILVVDDSLTTRTMERNLLETVGYKVEVAVDGADGWEKLCSGQFDLVVSDVDMPNLNGFELTERIRADARFADLPVVLVTAMESREDRDHGIRIGANAYVLKSAFDQSNLLEIVGRLI